MKLISPIKRQLVWFFLFSLVILFAASEKLFAASDQENCMLCHQYPLLGTVDDNGTFRSFYVSKEHYARSAHTDIRCSECHRGITKIPHEKGTVVDCASECHVLEPTTGRPFSHKGAQDAVNASMHGVSNKYIRSVVKEDAPECASCHIYEETSIRFTANAAIDPLVVEQGKGRCQECHLDRYGKIDKDIMHILRRTEKVNKGPGIVSMCTQCHNDEEFNKRHNVINAIYSYRENYHGKTMLLGLKTAPTCLDCHIKQGESPHKILSVKDPDSSTFPDFRGKMCSRSDCHPTASLGMGKASIHYIIDMHKFPVQFWLLFFFTLLTIGSFVSLMAIMIMELFRMIFPNFTIFKRR